MGFSYRSFLISFTAAHVFALPLSNTTDLEPGWVPEPTRRGTSGLIFSCVITLILCAWTAIHLNVIPSHTTDDPTRQTIWHKCCRTLGWRRATRLRIFFRIGWMLTALFAPEIVLWCAFCQWIEAKAVHKAWRDHFKIQEGEEDHLGIEGAFFVVMGGFTIGPHENDQGNQKPCTITPVGFVELLENGLIKTEKSLDKKVIADKGKADILAKSLVCVQALWMVIQCAGRKIGGLPVTLLELHVVMHVVCAVVMYGFWWNKPLDVYEQIPITEGRELLSLLKIIPHFSGKFTVAPAPSEPKLPYTVDTSLPNEVPIPTKETSLVRKAERLIPKNKSGLELDGRERTLTNLRDYLTGATPRSSRTKKIKQLIAQLEKVPNSCLVTLFPGESLGSKLKDGLSISRDEKASFNIMKLDAIDIEIISSAANAIREGKYKLYPWKGEDITVTREHNVLKGRISNIFLFEGPIHDIYRTLYLMISCCVVYGACHAIAWNSHFPTPTERWLWRVACLIIGIFPFFLMFNLLRVDSAVLEAVIDWVVSIFDYMMELPENILQRLGWKRGAGFAEKWMGRIRTALIGFFIVILGLLGVLYVVVRIFLMIESFISLRSLERGAYDNVVWAAYWPHF